MRALILVSLFVLVALNEAQIHRAVSHSSYQIRYDSNFTLHYFMKKSGNELNSRLNSSSTTSSSYGGLGRLVDSMRYYFDYNMLLMDRLYDDSVFVWVTTILGTFFVGICGILPVVLLPQLIHDHHRMVNSSMFKCLISFAAGSLLGDVFLHLLPETYINGTGNAEFTSNGLWTLFGLMLFFTIEKVFQEDESEVPVKSKGGKGSKKKVNKPKLISIKIIGVLNLIGNIVDNFSHGIAVAGSFQASFKFGVMTLFATLLHEIPHEIGDFAILLKAGLNYKQAALGQLLTAASGIIGAIFTLAYSQSAEKAGDATSWILSFTSGGFLYISLVNILPEMLLEEKDVKQSFKQLFCLYSGILVIYIIKMLF